MVFWYELHVSVTRPSPDPATLGNKHRRHVSEARLPPPSSHDGPINALKRPSSDPSGTAKATLAIPTEILCINSVGKGPMSSIIITRVGSHRRRNVDATDEGGPVDIGSIGRRCSVLDSLTDIALWRSASQAHVMVALVPG
jgi:hypothetical protein